MHGAKSIDLPAAYDRVERLWHIAAYQLAPSKRQLRDEVEDLRALEVREARARELRDEVVAYFLLGNRCVLGIVQLLDALMQIRGDLPHRPGRYRIDARLPAVTAGREGVHQIVEDLEPEAVLEGALQLRHPAPGIAPAVPAVLLNVGPRSLGVVLVVGGAGIPPRHAEGSQSGKGTNALIRIQAGRTTLGKIRPHPGFPVVGAVCIVGAVHVLIQILIHIQVRGVVRDVAQLQYRFGRQLLFNRHIPVVDTRAGRVLVEEGIVDVPVIQCVVWRGGSVENVGAVQAA